MPQQKTKKKMDRQHRRTGLPNQKNSPPVQLVHKNLQNSINVQDHIVDEFEKMPLYSTEDHGKKHSRTEAFASLDIILPNRKGVHELKIKVDTGGEGNTLPLRTFQQMFPEHVDRNRQSRPGTTQKKAAILWHTMGLVYHSMDPYKFNVPTRVNGVAWNST